MTHKCTQLYSEIGYTYVQKFYTIHTHSLNEGHVDLDGIKNRISDDNSLKNKMELYCNKLKYDE